MAEGDAAKIKENNIKVKETNEQKGGDEIK